MSRFYIFIFIISVLVFGCDTDSHKAVELKFNVDGKDNIAVGEQFWKGKDDCSFTTIIVKEALGIRVFVNVVDDELVADTIKKNFKDGVEIYFDTRPYRLRQKNRYMKGVFQAIIYPCFSKAYANTVDFYPYYYDSSVPGTRLVSKIKSQSNGYILNVFFPFSGFTKNHYSIDDTFYFDIAVNDFDSEGKTQLIWAGKSDNWKHPNNFKSITLK